VQFSKGNSILLFSHLSRSALQLIQPPIRRVQKAVNKGQKQRGRKGGYLLSRSAVVKNVLNYTFPNPLAFRLCNFRFGKHLFLLPIKSSTENIYTSSHEFPVVPCFQSHLKNIRKCKVLTSSENVSRISHLKTYGL
jgi:hypothetical protein